MTAHRALCASASSSTLPTCLDHNSVEPRVFQRLPRCDAEAGVVGEQAGEQVQADGILGKPRDELQAQTS